MTTRQIQTAKLTDLGQAQKERLAYIELRLYFLGDVRRQDLMERFGTAPAVATRDFALYRDLFPNNMAFDGRTKKYLIGDDFAPAFKHSADRVLTTLSLGFGDGAKPAEGPLLPCELPIKLNRPRLEVLAPVTRAIHRRKAVQLKYYSHTSGLLSRQIVPFAIVNDGLRWHARAFDRKSGEFRDFVFSRMEGTSVIEDADVQPHESPTADDEWNRIVELELVPHPEQAHPEITERDYDMQNGAIRVRMRAAVAGYVLRHWSVDCSPNHSLRGPEYRLWLNDSLALYGVESAILAPGYQPPAKGNAEASAREQFSSPAAS